jgi:LmbE family N-acetylglucosaminyl deacetylase
MAIAVRGGQRVVCVTATRGELGSTDSARWPNGAELAAVRTRELAASLAASLAVLGVTEHHWLDYPDGGCEAVAEDQAIARLRAIVDRRQPDTVLTFSPDGRYLPSGSYGCVALGVRGRCREARVLHQVATSECQAESNSVVAP